MRGPRGGECGPPSAVGTPGPRGQVRLSPGRQVLGAGERQRRGRPSSEQPARQESLEGPCGGLCSVSSQTGSLPRRPQKIHGLKNQFRFHGQPGRGPSLPDKGWAALGVGEAGRRPMHRWGSRHGREAPSGVWRQSPNGGGPVLWVWDPGQTPPPLWALVSPSAEQPSSPQCLDGRTERAPPAVQTVGARGGSLRVWPAVTVTTRQ